jgi:hypothetical protein
MSASSKPLRFVALVLTGVVVGAVSWAVLMVGSLALGLLLETLGPVIGREETMALILLVAVGATFGAIFAWAS